jgi:hypothetical protein
LYDEGAHRTASKSAIRSSSSSSSPVIPLGDHLLTNTGLIFWVGVLVHANTGSFIDMSSLIMVYKTESSLRPQPNGTEMLPSNMLSRSQESSTFLANRTRIYE